MTAILFSHIGIRYNFAPYALSVRISFSGRFVLILSYLHKSMWKNVSGSSTRRLSTINTQFFSCYIRLERKTWEGTDATPDTLTGIAWDAYPASSVLIRASMTSASEIYVTEANARESSFGSIQSLLSEAGPYVISKNGSERYGNNHNI